MYLAVLKDNHTHKVTLLYIESGNIIFIRGHGLLSRYHLGQGNHYFVAFHIVKPYLGRLVALFCDTEKVSSVGSLQGELAFLVSESKETECHYRRS